MGEFKSSLRRIAWWLGPLWAMGVSAYILIAPLIHWVGVSRSLSRGGIAKESAPIYTSSSWLKTYGPSAARPLAIPVLLSFVPLLGRVRKSRRIIGAACAVALGVFCALAIFSIGAFYLPSVVAMIAALVLESL